MGHIAKAINHSTELHNIVKKLIYNYTTDFYVKACLSFKGGVKLKSVCIDTVLTRAYTT
jgi:hypothetical protein